MSKANTSDTFDNEILAGESTGLVEASHINTTSIRNTERLDTVEHKLGTLAVLANTLVPDIPGGSNCEYQEEQNKEERLSVVCRNSLGGVDHGSDQVTLRSLEAGLHDDSHGTVIRGRGNTRGKLGLLLIGVSHSLVHNSSTLDQKHIASNTAVLLGSVDRGEVTRNELVTLYLGPFAQAEHPHIVGLDAHATEFIEVLVKHPKSNTEDLEDEERGDGMLLEELGEGRNGDVEGVGAIVLFNA
ncbi:hypothetical protein HG530_006033 [Fusarium avenaceum]|nr:hypothetical protein HG530_006033 [Fusarium avenaceum]